MTPRRDPAPRLAPLLLALLPALLLALDAGTAGVAGADPDPRDALGHPLPESGRPERIVSLSPNLTEILFAVGVDRERVAGITRFCDFPPEVSGIARVGGIVDPSVEGILALRPDLVLATRGNPVATLDRLRALGVPVVAFDSEGGLRRIERTIREVAELARPDDPARAESLLARFDAALSCLERWSRSVPPEERPSVFYYDPVSPDWTAGPGTHVDEAIGLAGGSNAAADAPIAWPRYSVEKLLADPPDLLLIAARPEEGVLPRPGDLLAPLRRRPGWRALPAVRDGAVCAVAADPLLRPGPRILEAVAELRRCLHPEADEECGE